MDQQAVERAARDLEVAANGVMDAAREWYDARPGHNRDESSALREAVKSWIDAGQAFAESQRRTTAPTTHEVQIEDEDDDGESTWVPCVVIARRPYSSGGDDAYDVRTADGREWLMCNPECVREAVS